MTSITQLLSPWPITKSSIVLREQLIAQSQNNMPSPPRDSVDMLPRSEQPASPQSNNGAEKLEGDSSMMTARSDSDSPENGGDGRKGYGKRELSTSKRAAQNRAAQRAFRQRKEGYIKKLEEQVRDYAQLNENYKIVQAENHQLRDYVISLQSRLLELQGEVPPPPSNVGGLEPGRPGHQYQQQPGLPSISEMRGDGPAVMQYPQELPREALYRPAELGPASKRTKVDHAMEMNPSQSALQGPSILEAAGGAPGR